MTNRIEYPPTQLYRVSNYSGPQCPGYLGDFLYLPPGFPIRASDVEAKMHWYASLPKTLSRIDTKHTAFLQYSNGFHAIDAIAMSLAVAEAATGGCHAMGPRYRHCGCWPRIGRKDIVQYEAIHDKIVSTCNRTKKGLAMEYSTCDTGCMWG